MRLIACLALALLGSCATSQQSARSELSKARLLRAEQLQAEKQAPKLYQQFRAASERARASKLDSAERGDYSAEARLWLEAAISEAELRELSRSRLQVEREAVASDELYLAREQQRLAAEHELELRAAGEVARLEAERSLARAALLPAQRTKLAPEELARAASALLARAEVVMLSLPVDAAQQAVRDQLAALLKEARAALGKAPDRALDLGDRALFLALSLVARLRNAGPSEPQTASLAEALRLAGAVVKRAETGLTASLPRLAGRSLERSVSRLCSIALAYPAGQVQLSHRPASGALTRLIEQQGCRGERFVVRKATGATGELLSMIFFAY